MTTRYLDLVLTPSVTHAQRAAYGAALAPSSTSGPDALGPAEAAFVAERDSFYLASVSESGSPYVQHRGGPRGFLRVVDPRTLVFADVRGNRQLVTVGNMSIESRVALFLMDYPGRRRLKLLGRATVRGAGDEPRLTAELGAQFRQRVERLVFITIEAFDWNCPQNITQRWSAEEVEELTAPLRARIEELAARLRSVGQDPGGGR